MALQYGSPGGKARMQAKGLAENPRHTDGVRGPDHAMAAEAAKYVDAISSG